MEILTCVKRAREYTLCYLLLIWLAIYSLTIYNLYAEEEVSYKASYVKAAYVLRFIDFVTWPKKAPNALKICVIGSDVMGTSIALAIEQEMNGANVLVEQRSYNARLEDCHIVFISHSVKDRINRILLTLGTFPVLTISDEEHFIEKGGIIGFVLDNQTLKFEINMNAAKKVKLGINAKLQQVAKRVIR